MNITTPYLGKGEYGIAVNDELVGTMVFAGGIDEYTATLDDGRTFTVRVGATLIPRIQAELTPDLFTLRLSAA